MLFLMITILIGVKTLKTGDVEDNYANHTILVFNLKGKSNQIYLPLKLETVKIN